jgi:mono/diheme cytochrome c family protein
MNRGPALLACVILSAASSLAAASGDPASGAEQVDPQTQAALSMDSHPDRGGQAFVRYCAKCHGPRALGDAKGAIPALAGQRYAYLKSFDDRDISATADYLSRLAGTGTSRKKMRDDGAVVD